MPSPTRPNVYTGWFSRRKFRVPTYLEYFTCRRSKPGLACQSHFPAKPYIFSCSGAKSCQHFRLCNDRSIISKILHLSSCLAYLPGTVLAGIDRQAIVNSRVFLNSFRRSLRPQHLPKRVGVMLLLFNLKLMRLPSKESLLSNSSKKSPPDK
jgi:hypothetical protein